MKNVYRILSYITGAIATLLIIGVIYTLVDSHTAFDAGKLAIGAAVFVALTTFFNNRA